VAHLRVARSRGHALGPRLDLRSVDLDRATAQSADEMVMMVAACCGGFVSATEAILRLPIRSVYDVDLAGVDEGLEVPVDRGQPDGLAASAQLSMEVLRRTKAARVTKHCIDSLALTSDPHPATAERPLRLHLTIVPFSVRVSRVPLTVAGDFPLQRKEKLSWVGDGIDE